MEKDSFIIILYLPVKQADTVVQLLIIHTLDQQIKSNSLGSVQVRGIFKISSGLNHTSTITILLRMKVVFHRSNMKPFYTLMQNTFKPKCWIII